MKIFFMALLLVPYPLISMANEADTVVCHQFNGSDAARLGCYDRATGFDRPADRTKSENDSTTKTGETNSEPVVPTLVSKWQLRSRTSAIDDSTNVFMTLVSDDFIKGRFGTAGPMVISIHCRENTTLFYINFNELFMSDFQHGRVTYRLDSTEARNVNMKESTDNMALGLWRGGSSIPFIKRMFGHEEMLVRATPHSESAVTATFSVAGLEEKIGPLREACNW